MMTQERRRSILKIAVEWQNEFIDMNWEDSFIALYNDKDISSKEFVYMIGFINNFNKRKKNPSGYESQSIPF